MASELVTDFESWEPSTVSYGPVKINSHGGKNVRIYDAKRNTLRIGTGMNFTWGCQRMDNENGRPPSYTVAIQHPSDGYDNPSGLILLDKLKQLDEKILNDAVTHSKEWFGRVYTRPVLEALYNPILKYPKIKGTEDPDYSRAPTSKVKIQVYNNEFKVKLWDHQNKQIYKPGDLLDNGFEDFIPKKSLVGMVIQCNGFWFIGGKFGVSFQMVQGVVRKPVDILDEDTCFISLKQNDLDIIKKTEQKEAEERENNDSGPLVSDDEEEEDDVVLEQVNEEVKEAIQEATPEPETTKPKKKRVIRKKTVTADV